MSVSSFPQASPCASFDGAQGTTISPALRDALGTATDDVVVYDLGGIESAYATLRRELPEVEIRFAVKACPVDEVVARLGALGAGVDCAGPAELEQAMRAGVPVELVHYGNTVKSDRDIAFARQLGVGLFATDSVEDVMAIAEHAPGAAVFCRLAISGLGALWGLTGKFGCSPAGAVRVLTKARSVGLTAAGVSVHVGSQQMTAASWAKAFDTIGEVLAASPGWRLVNLGGGLPALGYLDRYGAPMRPPIDKIFTVIREGIQRLRKQYGKQLRFVLEPGRYLVADHSAIRAEVVRMTERFVDGQRRRWLYLSCGRFNGLHELFNGLRELDALHFRLHFPDHSGDLVPAMIGGPTRDSDDAATTELLVPSDLVSGAPVWILSSGAYALSYCTQSFNGFTPLRYVTTGGPS